MRLLSLARTLVFFLKTGTALAVLLNASTAKAQMVGIAALLNPEGSRLFPQAFVAPRHPGKPDPRWRSFNWHYTDLAAGKSEYRLFFYEDELWTARFVVPRIQAQVEALTKLFKFSPPKKFSYLLFTSLRDFQQANIFFITEGVQGITSTTEATMAIPYLGQARAFDHVSKHEMIHQFQVQKLQSKDEYRAAEMEAMIPLWFIEGMAEYHSLDGMDPESRMYLRDVILYPDKKRDYSIPGFFEDGALDFIHVYKIGQAKITFLETEFGSGTSQRILDHLATGEGKISWSFRELVSADLKRTPEEIETRWTDYLKRAYQHEANQHREQIDDAVVMKEPGENLDYFDLSPDGNLLVYREVDPLIGVASIRLFDFKSKKTMECARDRQPNLLSLYFLQNPTVTVSANLVSYMVETTSGPELETRRILRDPSGEIQLLDPIRTRLHANGLIQVSSIAFSPDEKSLALVGLTPKGWTNVYVLDLSKGIPNHLSVSPLKQLTDGHYNWRTLNWNHGKLLAASDRTDNGKEGIFAIDPKTGTLRQLTSPGKEQVAPEWLNNVGAPSFVYQSWETGSSQIHQWAGGSSFALTDVKTGLFYPKVRAGSLYALAFKSGRYRLVRFENFGKVIKDNVSSRKIDSTQLMGPVGLSPAAAPWSPELAEIPESQIHSYRPFITSGMRIDGLFAYFGSGSVGGIAASVSDLMRNYNISGEFSVLGSLKYTNAYLFFSSEVGRLKWTTGAYGIVQPRLDTIFHTDDFTRTYLHREYGVLGALQYPIAAFSYIDLELRIGAVKRSDISDPVIAPEWEAVNPGSEFHLGPIVRLGYDGILYEAYTGPVSGFGILVESDTSFFPRRQATAQRVRLDVAQYFQLTGRTVLALQGMTGVAWAKDFGNAFLVSSDDILRGYFFLDNRLYGTYLAAVKSEIRFPIGTLFGFPPLRGLVGGDLGTVYRNPGDAGKRVASSYTGGLSLNIPPLSVNFMLSYPIRTAPGPVDSPVAHFTLRYLYL